MNPQSSPLLTDRYQLTMLQAWPYAVEISTAVRAFAEQVDRDT